METGLHSGVWRLSDRCSYSEHKGSDRERDKLLHGGDHWVMGSEFGDLSRELLSPLDENSAASVLFSGTPTLTRCLGLAPTDMARRRMNVC
jgi:hypothetical protein